MTKLTLGSQGEAAVAEDLQRKGYTILARNYRRPCGEIDIIACTKQMLIFVEVKTRTTNYFDPAELITPTKQKRILRTAEYFLMQNNYATMACRFDSALISWQRATPTITYLQDAFSSDLA